MMPTLGAHRWCRSRGAIVTITLAWAVAGSVAASAAPNAVLGYGDARHLLARTGFGPTNAEVAAYAPLTRTDAVAKLLREARTTAITPPPASAVDNAPLRAPRGEDASEAERKAFVQAQIRAGLELRAWWMQEMLVTPSPLTERMTLFWHNHFVSSQQKVRFARLMYRQNATLRSQALGNFATLLHAMARDPAMVIYLDSARNRKGAPNENFAREVMELFTLGEGHYSEQDVKEAARAFTGWSLDRDTGTFVFRPLLHDDGGKTVLGKSGRFDGDAVLDLLLERPETTEHIVAKLWREFVSPEPDPREVARIARRFRESSYEMTVALTLLLTSDAFYAAENRGVLVKSPVELVVGTLRPFGFAPGDALPFALVAAGMGQNLFAPPNVKGWPGGEVWINTTTLLARKQFLDRVTRADDVAPMSAVRPTGKAVVRDAVPSGGETDVSPPDMARTPDGGVAAQGLPDDAKARAQRLRREVERGLASVRFDSGRWLATLPGDGPAARAQSAQRLLLATAPLQMPDGDADALTLVRGLVLDAAYQLK
jgi:uncharacterized protein (DUF1800 family)